jgi:histidine triad (HIT) family protein
VHVRDAQVNPYITANVFRAAALWAQGKGEFNLITSKGVWATQTIDHLHVHFVPRSYRDGLSLPWTGQHG